MTKLLTQNSKLKKSSGGKSYNFGIPAYKSMTGKITCPFAKDCIKGCYAQQGAYIWGNVKPAFEHRLKIALSNEFCKSINEEIDSKRKINKIRVHDSGDFFSREYFYKWLCIAEFNPKIKFYAYTKSVKMIKAAQKAGHIPKNFIFIFSFGGKQDHLIDIENDRHSVVFDSIKELKAARYTDASEDDTKAIGKNKKIGLVYHGAKSKNNFNQKAA